ncbi:MAG TPA: phytanoyl-CoA dioxygenase family protein [Burkholderiales bacterium]|nr:phytanoyl-CoA dioxygenase family protein [Burkholderiales bacterium]
MSHSTFTAEQARQFRIAGFVLVPQLASAQRVRELRAVALEHLATGLAPVEYEADLRYPGAPASRHAPGGATVRRLLQAYARDAAFRAWATAPEIALPLRRLLGDELMLSLAHHNCVMTKQPHFSSETGWHQDIRYWSFERPELVSVWLALGREFPDNGCLSFLPGSHEQEFAAERLDDALFLRADGVQNQALIATRLTPVLEPGDAVFFHCRTLHAAGSNHTDQSKLSLVFTYHAADNRPLPGTRSAALPSVRI